MTERASAQRADPYGIRCCNRYFLILNLNNKKEKAFAFSLVFVLPAESYNLDCARARTVTVASCVAFGSEDINSSRCGESATAAVNYCIISSVNVDYGAERKPVTSNVMRICHTVAYSSSA